LITGASGSAGARAALDIAAFDLPVELTAVTANE
jgi:hypothetical protein